MMTKLDEATLIALRNAPQTPAQPETPGKPGALPACANMSWLGAFKRSAYSRYKIWSVQKRSRRCSALFSTANSSAAMPPTCSTVRTCFS